MRFFGLLLCGFAGTLALIWGIPLWQWAILFILVLTGANINNDAIDKARRK